MVFYHARGSGRGAYRGKVATLATLLIINNLSGYKTGYTFGKVATSLAVKDLSGYTNVKVDFTEGNEEIEGGGRMF
jgi:hypothetical protein